MMKHSIHNGSNDHVIIHLHGTGGDAAGLLGLGQMIDPNATLIGIDGDVFENGMRRYFKRYPDGSFDLESLHENTQRLYDTIQHVLTHYMLDGYTISVLGYSNGANIAQNLIKEHAVTINNLILYHPSPTRMDVPFKKQENLRVFMTGGKQDPFISKDDFKTIQKHLKDADIKVKTFVHDGGHELIHEEIMETKAFINK